MKKIGRYQHFRPDKEKMPNYIIKNHGYISILYIKMRSGEKAYPVVSKPEKNYPVVFKISSGIQAGTLGASCFIMYMMMIIKY